MAETVIEYPKRPKFFAYKLTRMMFKTALANDIGPEACHLIIQIAHTEDATRYSKPVTFYNEQLLPVCGFTNVKSLDRARAKAVRSGWLVYLPGGKSKAGKYWTTIPEQYIHLDDGAIDESNSSTELQATTEDTTYLPVAGKETGDKRETNGREEPEKRDLNARETPEKWATITSIPNPSPIEEIQGARQIDFPKPKMESVVNPKASLITFPDGRQLDFEDDMLVWQAEFIRQWNELPRVSKHTNNVLAFPNLRMLTRNFHDPDWDWAAAFSKFPVWRPRSTPPSMSWFLSEGTVNQILEGECSIRVPTSGERNGKQKSIAGGAGVNYDPNARDKNPNYGKFPGM